MASLSTEDEFYVRSIVSQLYVYSFLLASVTFRVIIEWSKDPNRGIGPFHSKRMETAHFIDLTARLGQPYVFIHQGDCEHIVIFSDIRSVLQCL